MSWKLCHRRVDLVGGIASHRRLGKWRTHLSRRLAFSRGHLTSSGGYSSCQDNATQRIIRVACREASALYWTCQCSPKTSRRPNSYWGRPWRCSKLLSILITVLTDALCCSYKILITVMGSFVFSFSFLVGLYPFIMFVGYFAIAEARHN
jgi:hypothetical protein